MRALTCPVLFAQGPPPDPWPWAWPVGIAFYAVLGVCLMGGWSGMKPPQRFLMFVVFTPHVLAYLALKPVVEGGKAVCGMRAVRSAASFAFTCLFILAVLWACLGMIAAGQH